MNRGQEVQCSAPVEHVNVMLARDGRIRAHIATCSSQVVQLRQAMVQQGQQYNIANKAFPKKQQKADNTEWAQKS